MSESMNLQPVEYSQQRILTTSQLAEAYGTDVKHINDNFQNNKDRYTEGKHYYYLTGQNLKDFLNLYPEYFGDQKIRRLYLWTERGAFLHAKSLKTDAAWDVYEHLVDAYYEQQQVISQQQQVIAVLQKAKEVDEAIRRLTTIIADRGTDYDDGDRQVASVQLMRFSRMLSEFEDLLKKQKKAKIKDYLIPPIASRINALETYVGKIEEFVKHEDEENDQLIEMYSYQMKVHSFLQQPEAQKLLN